MPHTLHVSSSDRVRAMPTQIPHRRASGTWRIAPPLRMRQLHYSYLQNLQSIADPCLVSSVFNQKQKIAANAAGCVPNAS